MKTSFGKLDLYGVHYRDADGIDVDLRNAGYGGTVLMNANMTDEFGTGRIEISGGLGTSINFRYGEKYFPPDLFPSRGSLTAYTYSRSLSNSFVSLSDQLDEYISPELTSTQPEDIYKQFSLLDGAPVAPPGPLDGPGTGYFNSFRWTSGTFAQTGEHPGGVFENSRPGAIQIDGVSLTVEPVQDILANIQLSPHPVGHGIEAAFSPQGPFGAVKLADLAYAMGFSHFNWISEITLLPDTVQPPRDKKGNTLHPSIIDPPPGGYETWSYGKVFDSLPYYIDVPGFGGTDSNLGTYTVSNGTSLKFQDLPRFPGIGGEKVYFCTTLVGVKQSDPTASVPLKSFTWYTTYDGGSGGVTAASNPLDDGLPTDGSGSATIVDDDVAFDELSAAVIAQWAALGVDLSSLPLRATDDVAVTALDASVVIPVLSNDFGPTVAGTVGIVSPPGHGSVTVDPASGKMRYTPNPGFLGSDSFRYTVQDASGAISNQADVTVQVEQAPQAGDDTATVRQGQPTKIDVFANDSDADGTLGPASVSIVRYPAHGSVSVNPTSGRVLYSPAAGYVGPDDFTYTVADNLGLTSNEATVRLNVIPQPPTPTLVAVSLLSQPAANQAQIAIDFSVAMDTATAQAAGNYAVALEGSPGLRVVSSTYADSQGLHRGILVVQGDGPLAGGEYTVRLDGRSLRSAEGVPMATASERALVLINDINSVVTVGLQDDTDLPGTLQASALGSGPPTSLVVGDFGGDGVADIVTVRPGIAGGDKGGGQMLFLRGLGSGRFAEPVAYDLDRFYNAVKVIAADWNGDGAPDVIVGAYENHFYDVDEKLYVFLNDGQGRFTRAPQTPFVVTHTSGFQFPVGGSIEAADLLPNPGPEVVAFKQGYHNAYAGTDQPGEIQIIGKDPFLGYDRLETIPLGVAMSPGNFAFADFNGDGRLDILISGSSLILVPSSGATGFGAARDITFEHLSNYGGSLAGIGDVTGDGKLDLVLVHDEYSNNAGVNDGDVTTVLAGDGQGHFNEVSRTLMNRRGSSLLALKDMDGDGKFDLVLGETWNDGPDGYAGFNWPDVAGPSTWVWKGDGRGHFAQPATPPVLVSTATGGFAAWALADLDNDGDLDAIDAIAASPRLALALNDGRGKLDPTAVDGLFFGSAQAVGANSLAAGDLNRDGLPDLVKITSQTIEILVGQPDGGFRPHDSVNVSVGGSSVSSVALGDLNGDGILDIVTGGNRVVVLIGRGDASFAPAAFYGPENNAYVSNLALADVNRDGKLDAVATISEYPDINFAVLFGDGTGRLLYNLNTRISTAGGADITVADLDGDGKVDILDTTSGLKLLHGNGDGTFTAGATSQPAHSPGYVRVVDLNGDGRPDLIGLSGVNNFSGELYAYINDGTGHFTESFAGPSDGRALALAAGDFDADGKIDVLVGLDGLDIFGQGDRDALLFYRGDGQGGFAPFQRLAAGGSSATAILTQASDSIILAGSIDLVASSTIQFGATTATAPENSGTVTLTVTRTGDSGLAASVAYAVTGGTATAGADFQLAAGTLNFAPGEAMKSIVVTLIDDALVEGDETVQLTLSDVSGAGASLGSPSAATLTITDDDTTPPAAPGAPQLTVASDTGADHHDGLTRANGSAAAPLTFSVSGVSPPNAWAQLYEVSPTGSATAWGNPVQASGGTATVTVADAPLSDGAHKIAARAARTAGGTLSALSAATAITVQTSLRVTSITPGGNFYNSTDHRLPPGNVVTVTFNHWLDGITINPATGYASPPFTLMLIPAGPDGLGTQKQTGVLWSGPSGYDSGDLPLPGTLRYTQNPDGTATLTLTPGQPLAPDVYLITVGGLTDRAGNLLADAAGHVGNVYSSFNYRPANTTAPAIVSVTTQGGAVRINDNSTIPLPDTIAIAFNRPMDTYTINTTTVRLLARTAAGTFRPVQEAVTYSPSTNTAYLTPEEVLVPGVQYRIDVSTAVTDDQGFPTPGYPLAVGLDRPFTVTGAPPAPRSPLTVTASSPVDGTAWTQPLGYGTVTFSEPLVLDPAHLGRFSAMWIPQTGGVTTGNSGYADVPYNAKLAFNPNTNQLVIVPTGIVTGVVVQLFALSGINARNGDPLTAPGHALPVYRTFLLSTGGVAHAALPNSSSTAVADAPVVVATDTAVPHRAALSRALPRTIVPRRLRPVPATGPRRVPMGPLAVRRRD